MKPWHQRIVTLALIVLSVPSFAAKPLPEVWVGTWATSPVALANKPDGLGTEDTTLREIVHVSRAGKYARVILTNEFGTEPLRIGAAHVALASPGSSIQLTTANALTFGGSPSIVIPAGALAVSDGFAFTLPAAANVAVSIFVPVQKISTVTVHSFANQTSYMAEGNSVSKASLDGAKEFTNWSFLKGIDVRVEAESAGAIVTFGDSITDGSHSTKDANTRWPDILAKRLQADKKTRGLGVLNEGIGGNRILHDGTGPNALARFDRDVLVQAGVKYVVILEGINDLGHAFDPKKTYDVISAEDLITGVKQMAERAHAHGIKIIGGTLTPYVGAGYQSAAGETARQTYNAWIRSNQILDGVIDFDKLTQDPSNPGTFLPAYDSGDHLHPADAGYKAMGEGIDLKLFESKK